MQEKLNLKISGLGDAEDLKLIESNLKSLEGVRNFAAAPFDRHTEIKLEHETGKITKQQIFDVIRIGGDFNIEEQKTSKIKPREIIESASQNHQLTADNSASSGCDLTEDVSKVYFILGILIVFFLASLLLNVVLGYNLLSTDSL